MQKKEAVIDRGNFNARSITNYTDTEMPSSLISDEKFYFLDEWPTDSVSDFKNLAGLSADLKNFIAKIDLEVPQIADKAKSLRNELQTLHSAKHRKWEQETLPLQQKIKDLQAGLKSVEEQEFSQKYGNKDKSDSPELSIPFLVQTNITRFGPMIIMFFFCSILVNLYRYHRRLSAYYDARADALALSDTKANPLTFEKLVKTLSPDMHDIGRAPKLPTEYVLDMAKAAFGKTSNSKE